MYNGATKIRLDIDFQISIFLFRPACLLLRLVIAYQSEIAENRRVPRRPRYNNI